MNCRLKASAATTAELTETISNLAGFLAAAAATDFCC